MNVRKAIQEQTPEFWHEIGAEIKDYKYAVFLACTPENKIELYGMCCPVDVYILGSKYPRTQMTTSPLIPKNVRKILSNYTMLHFR